MEISQIYCGQAALYEVYKLIKTLSYQATVPAAKFTKFCATCIAILFGSKTPVYTVAGSTFDLFSIG